MNRYDTSFLVVLINGATRYLAGRLSFVTKANECIFAIWPLPPGGSARSRPIAAFVGVPC